MSQNEKKIKTKEKGKESENQFYSHLNKIYKEIDEEGEIYTEGFTPEQIYYQIEEVSEKILKEAKKKMKIKGSKDGKSKGKVKDEENSKGKDEIEERHEDDHQDDRNEEDSGNEEEDSGNESMNDSEYSDNPSPLVIENIGTDYSDCSSVDEETYSEDSTPFDPEEMKSKPASELFKTLDKNIRRK